MRSVLPGSLISLAFLALLPGVASAQGSHAQGPYSFDIVMGGGSQPVYVSGGQAYVAGVFGQAYEIRVHNRSGQRVEAVVAVDGRDVITGEPIDPRRHRGHLVHPWGQASIAGFRSSDASVAQFRFSTIPRSYAWRTGTAWGIGTIRVWIFEESVPEPIVVLPYGVPGAQRGATAGEAAPSAPRDMGTEYGEQRWSPVVRTHFVRRSHSANAILGVHYQSHEALAAAGILHPVARPVVIYGDAYDRYYGYDPQRYAPPPPPY
jgi:hypothetical protein